MITPAQAADIVNYLADAGGMTIGSDNQGVVWADYINAPETGVPTAQAADLLPAARHCLQKWAAEGRSWRVDGPRFVQSLKRVRSDRLAAFLHEHEFGLHPTDREVTDDGRLYLAWKKAASEAVISGVTDLELVHRAAYAAIGRTPPPPAITTNHEINFDKIGQRA